MTDVLEVMLSTFSEHIYPFHALFVVLFTLRENYISNKNVKFNTKARVIDSTFLHKSLHDDSNIALSSIQFSPSPVPVLKSVRYLLK